MSKLSSSLQGDVCLWATHAGAELDLLVSVAGRRSGFEFKYADASDRRHSMHIARRDPQLEHLWVVYPGRQEYALDNRISVIPLKAVSWLPKK